MKKYLILFLLFCKHNNIFGLKNFSSQTFITTRPAYFNIEAYSAFWHNMAYCNENKLTSYQFITYYQNSSSNCDRRRSVHSSEYFLLPCKNVLSVKGDQNQNCNRDVRAEWLTLPSNFDGTFTMFPQQKQIAFYVEFKHDLGKQFQVNIFRNFWFGMGLSAQFVENRVNTRQDIINTVKNETITAALNRPQICWGKFLDSREIGLSDIRFKMGTELFPRPSDFQINTQSYLLVPLEGTQSVKKIFAAKQGFNGHWGIGTIVNIQVPLTKKCADYLVSFCLDIEDLFLFKKKQDRIFDLKKKPWSRYLLLNSKDGERNIPAINVLTQCVEVKPFNMVDLSAGFRYKRNCFEAELTYGLWAHGNENIKLKRKFPKIYGIAAPAGQFTVDGFPATASKSTISTLSETDKNAQGENIFVPITKNDIDLKSGAARETLSHRVNMAAGSTYHGTCLNVLWGIGGFVEIPQNNAALEQWGIWAKIGATF